MKTYIALLKGINVGGHKKVPMAELRSLLGKAGLKNVATYIQTGNVVFHTSEDDRKSLEEIIKNAIHKHFGFEVSILIKTRADLQAILDNCPFDQKKKEKSYFSILSRSPEQESVEIASEKTYPNEEFVIINDCIYLYAENYGNAKYNNNYFERKLNAIATARNYNTMMKLLSLSSEN